MVFNLRSVAFQVPKTEGGSDAVAATKVRVYNLRLERLLGLRSGRLAGAREYHGLDNAIALVSEAPSFRKQRRSLGFPGWHQVPQQFLSQ